MSAAWLSEAGLILDMIAFVILSIDLTSSMKGEREARDEILALQKAAFYARYGRYGPSADVVRKEEEDFAAKQKRRFEESEGDMWRRSVWATLAIVFAAVGGVLQIAGGWPA